MMKGIARALHSRTSLELCPCHQYRLFLTLCCIAQRIRPDSYSDTTTTCSKSGSHIEKPVEPHKCKGGKRKKPSPWQGPSRVPMNSNLIHSRLHTAGFKQPQGWAGYKSHLNRCAGPQTDCLRHILHHQQSGNLAGLQKTASGIHPAPTAPHSRC